MLFRRKVHSKVTFFTIIVQYIIKTNARKVIKYLALTEELKGMKN